MTSSPIPIANVAKGVLGAFGIQGALIYALKMARTIYPDVGKHANLNLILSFLPNVVRLGTSSAVVLRILSNAALTNRLYALENGPNADRVIELIEHLAKSVPEDRRDAVLKHLEQNWDSLIEDFFAVCGEDAETARSGARRLADNRNLNKILGLNDQAFSTETLAGTLEILAILAGSSNDDSSSPAVLNSGQYLLAVEAIHKKLFRHMADLFWMRQTRDMPPLPEDASPEMTIAGMTMHSIGIQYADYEKPLSAAEAQRKAENAEPSE